MLRGEVWWANLPPPAGRRPVLLLSRNSAYPLRTSATVAPVTRTIRNIATEVVLERADGMPSRCVVNLDDIMTVPQELIQERITSLLTEKMERVNRAVMFALDLSSGG